MGARQLSATRAVFTAAVCLVDHHAPCVTTGREAADELNMEISVSPEELACRNALEGDRRGTNSFSKTGAGGFLTFVRVVERGATCSVSSSVGPVTDNPVRRIRDTLISISLLSPLHPCVGRVFPVC